MFVQIMSGWLAVAVVIGKIDELTVARRPVASVTRIARAGITPLSVVAICIVMTTISASTTFIYICS